MKGKEMKSYNVAVTTDCGGYNQRVVCKPERLSALVAWYAASMAWALGEVRDWQVVS